METTYELTPEQLRRSIDPQTLPFRTTDELESIEGLIGQERAMAALQLGLGIHDDGFNIYVAGPPGVGKMTAVRAFIEKIAQDKPTMPDLCYVNNFDDPSQPLALKLPTGYGRRFQQDMERVVRLARRAIPKAFESDEYNARREEISSTLHAQRDALLAQLNERASAIGFSLQVMPFGIIIVPMLKGRVLNDEEFQALPSQERDELLRSREGLQEEMKAAMKQLRDQERTVQEQIQALEAQVALYVVGGLLDDLLETYRELPQLVAYLNAVQKDILDHIATFKEKADLPIEGAAEGFAMAAPWAKELPFRRYQVNVIVDNSKCVGAPVIVELNPSYANLFGRIEKESMFGTLFTDFTLIKGGAIQRANGGYLVLPVEELLRSPFSWDGIRRALRSREAEITEPGEQLGFMSTRSLRPQPIPLDLKIVLIGAPLPYYLLHAYDEQFPQLFKVRADFDTTMDWTDEHAHSYARLVATFCRHEQLRHLDAAAMACLLEHLSRLAEDQSKLSSSCGVLSDLVREADFWAAQSDAAIIGASHVRKALEQKTYRAGMIQQHIQELITQGTLRIDTQGQAIGQVNGLAVLNIGDHFFGKPSRITASVGLGRGGIVDIEREVKLGGAVHSKGVFILSGYLTQKYARASPLSLTARIGFEQSYEGVEGDSASAAELYALLSALAGTPIAQGIAVTGSVDQHGAVQAIGGVNQKIEGFFDVCQAQAGGLTGAQGVLIPRSNMRHLMLRDDVVAAARAGQFHIWAVDSVEQGITILTGVLATASPLNGRTARCIDGLIDARLRDFTLRLRTANETERPALVLN